MLTSSLGISSWRPNTLVNWTSLALLIAAWPMIQSRKACIYLKTFCGLLAAKVVRPVDWRAISTTLFLALISSCSYACNGASPCWSCCNPDGDDSLVGGFVGDLDSARESSADRSGPAAPDGVAGISSDEEGPPGFISSMGSNRNSEMASAPALCPEKLPPETASAASMMTRI